MLYLSLCPANSYLKKNHMNQSNVPKNLDWLWMIEFCPDFHILLGHVTFHPPKMHRAVASKWLPEKYSNYNYNQYLTICPKQLWCLCLLQVPKCFVLIIIVCTRPKIYLHIVAVTKILCETIRWFAFSKIVFLCRHKSFWRVKFFGWLKRILTGKKHFGTCKRTRHKSLIPWGPNSNSNPNPKWILMWM